MDGKNPIGRGRGKTPVAAALVATAATALVTALVPMPAGSDQMNRARADVMITANKPADQGLEGLVVPAGPAAAAASKAATAAYLSSDGADFTTRTASFGVQEHFPPGMPHAEGGPLFGVQFSRLGSEAAAHALPLGLSADPGGTPIYKIGGLPGGLGLEADGHYSIDSVVTDTNNMVLGMAGTVDAPEFGFDVSAQKARAAAFVSSRGMGLSARPFFPDGQDDASPAPFSLPASVFSPFNNGLQIFAGGTVLFNNGVRVGSIGVSGDGIDQDDLTSRAGSRYPPFPCILPPC